LNLAVRFLLEIAGVVGLFRLGLWAADGPLAVLLALVFSIGAATAWGLFNVPGDRSRSGRAPVQVSGAVRLLVESVLLGGGSVGWFLAGPIWFAWTYTVTLVIHYLLSWDRVGWLLGWRAKAP
jgi:hypothetical protein